MEINPKPIMVKRATAKATITNKSSENFDIPKITPVFKDTPDRYFRPLTFIDKNAKGKRWATITGVLVLTFIALHLLLNRLFIPKCQPAKMQALQPQTPVVLAAVAQQKTAEPPKNELPDRVVNFIHTKESSKGQAPQGWHKTCEAQGKWNEIGYGGNGYCFKDKATGLTTLRAEMAARIEARGLLETLCVYNLGYNRDAAGNRIPYTGCSYYDEFMSYGN